MKRTYLIVFLGIVSSLWGDPIGKYRRLHARVWERPKMVCSHAAVAVYDAARRDGLSAMIVRFQIPQNGPYRFHALPVVWINDRWHVIDMKRTNGEFVSLSRAVSSMEEVQDHIKNGRLTGRTFLKWYDFPSPRLIHKWRQELAAGNP